MNAAQKSLENSPVSAPEPSHPVDVNIPQVSDPASVTVVGSAPSHSSPSHSSPSHLASVVLLSTDSIDVGDSPNRLESAFDSEDFFLLSESILHNRGNVQPIAVRELAPGEIHVDSTLRYRLISGARRLRACAMHQLPVLAIVQKVLPTRELIDRLVENHLRQPLSPYELGMQLQHIIETSKSISRRELARLVGLDASIVQKAIDIAALPAPVLAAFSSASEIQYRDAKPLKDAVALAKDAVLACAESLKGQGVSSKDIVTKLTQAAETAASNSGQGTGVEPFNTPAGPLAITVDGKPLGSLGTDKKGQPQIHIAVALNPRQQADLAQLIEKFLHHKVLYPAVRRPSAKKATKQSPAETQTAGTDQPAANDSQVTGKERA